MSDIFKLYINNNNNLTDLYLFIKNKYLSNNLLEPIVELQSKYQNAKHFIDSKLFNSTFKDDFSNGISDFILPNSIREDLGKNGMRFHIVEDGEVVYSRYRTGSGGFVKEDGVYLGRLEFGRNFR